MLQRKVGYLVARLPALRDVCAHVRVEPRLICAIPAANVWSMLTGQGLIQPLYFVTPRPPFNAPNLQQLHAKIVMGKVSRLPPCFSDDINNLVRRMLELDVRSPWIVPPGINGG